MLERYELKRLLGQGAAGDVYLASDRLRGGREVALKRISARVDESLRRAFEREFATMASLAIPGVAQVYDFGVMQVEGSEGRTFYTRAYIDGRPLDQACATATPAQRVRLVVEVAHVIALMHRVGVVHGDIKPGNAIVDARGDAHVIDFGLSRVMGQARGEQSAGGTLPFMAPELLHGAAPSVQSDVFALGVTLWFLLTAGYPFGRKGMLDVTGGARPAVPDDVDDVTRAALEVALRALAHDPLDRLPTVAELIAALEEVTPAEAARAPRRMFVPPRPRGHNELLGRMQASIARPGARALLVTAPGGGGKSLLLRELKWRMQIRAAQVLEVTVDGDVKAPLIALLRQLEIALGADARATAATTRARAALQAARIEQSEFAEALGEALAALAARGPAVILIDDVDRGEALTFALVRSAMFADANGAVTVIGTATDAEAPAVREFSASESIEIPPLSRIELQALATDALGAIDASVLDALYEHTRGLPAALIDALASLWELPAPTVADVRKLPPLGASLALLRARLGRLPASARELLAVLSLLGRVESDTRLGEVMIALGAAPESLAELIARTEELGLVVRHADGLDLADIALEKAVLQELGEGAVRELATRVLASDAAPAIALVQRARLSVLAADARHMRELVPAAGEQLLALGAHGAAAELYEALLERSEGACQQRALLTLARCRHALGELERAAQLAARLLARADISAELRADAAIVSAQALTGLGRFDEAVATLSLVPSDAEPQARARVQRELANVHLRRGDYDAMQAAAESGLSCAEDDVVRSELLCARGMVASYRAEHAVARESLEQAVALAHRASAAREEASALAALAISHFRTGDLLSARDLFAQCLEVARRIGDIGSMANSALNLGVLLLLLGEPGAAAEHYESAARLSSRAGRMATFWQARCNLAHLHIYFGLYERAKAEVSSVLDEARDAKRKYIRAQATALLGDLAARSGDVERALINYDDAIARYSELGQNREVAEHHLDAADALLDRGGPADASAAAARLASARGPIEREKLVDLGLRLQLSLARTRLSSGEAEGALTSLQEVIDKARTARNRDVEWCAIAAAAQAHELLGAAFAARRFQRLAVEVLEDIALRIPREHREAFWHDPRRRAARERAIEADESTHRSAAPLAESSDLSALMGDARAARLLDIIKRLAGEHDLDRLLERITESAVDLSGAERGYVLLVDKQGQLEKRTVQVAKAEEHDPHAAFSRSIAEAVLIDGDPIVTVDATRDGRLSEYVSVHKLMLRSVACLPIHGRLGPVGVLYLEHRQSRGRFSEASVTLLHAFADQAAIALENARLMAENARRQDELQQANLALEKAKLDLEELLSARTEALLQAQRELTETRRSANTRATRHGMVGRSPAMLRVFDTIDRVQGAKVPVIVQGESGTGKELVARAIHQAGPRAKAPFVVVNCGSLTESLLESELFGHVAGAFSGAERDKRGLIARASGGTLFLDEVSDMPAKMQINLLRVLQEGAVCKVGGDEEERVDVRVIAASHHELEDLVEQGRFREDLYYRLNVVEISLPPLRARREDIPLLCQHFLHSFAERDRQPEKRLSREAIDRLVRSPLRGNVRQLEHVLLQAWVMVEGGVIEAADLALEADPEASPSPLESSMRPPAVECLDDFRANERRKILAALEEHGWNRVRAAKALGMPRRTFYRRLQEHHILERAEVG